MLAFFALISHSATSSAAMAVMVTGPVPDYNGPGNALVTFERRI